MSAQSVGIFIDKAVAGLLALSAAQHHEHLAAVPVAALLGRFRGFYLCDCINGVLVHRFGA